MCYESKSKKKYDRSSSGNNSISCTRRLRRSKTDSGQTNTYVAPEETNGVVNGTNLEGLPIAAEPITLTVGSLSLFLLLPGCMGGFGLDKTTSGSKRHHFGIQSL